MKLKVALIFSLILGVSAGVLVIASAITSNIDLIYGAIVAGALAIVANVIYAVVRKCPVERPEETPAQQVRKKNPVPTYANHPIAQ